MVMLVIIVSFSPMILVGGVIYNQFHDSYHEKVYAHLRVLVKKHKQNIDGFLKEKLSDIRFFSRSFGFEQLSSEAFLQIQLEEMRKEYGDIIEDLGVVNQKGLQIAYSGPFKLVKADYSDAGWFKKALQNDYVISDVFLGLRGLPHFIVTVRQKWQGEFWILRASINFMTFNSIVENLRIGQTGVAFILNREGEFQTRSHFETMQNKEGWKGLLNDLTKSMDKDDICVVEKQSLGADKEIYAAAFLKDNDWILVFRQNVSDAFSDLRRAQMTAVMIFIMGGLVIITMSLLLSDRMVDRIAKADREKEMMNQQVIETGKLASVGELAAGIAHEINNPVAIMVEEAGWIQDLLEEEEFKEGENLSEFQRALKQIQTQGRRCKEITHKLLSFARKTDSRIQDIQVNELIGELVGLSAQSAKYNKVSIKTDFQENLPPIRMSHTEMQQVLLNLINNAIYAMEKEGGTIDISTRLEDDRLLIKLSDTGPGIPRAILGRIFDPFFTTKPVGKGTGLGLSICYGIIKKMGGEIDVQSVVDVGTTFRIRLPLKKEEET